MLKQLMLHKRMNKLQEELDNLDFAGLEERKLDLEKAIEEAETDEELEAVEEEITKADEEKAGLEAAEEDLKAQLAELQKELEELKENAPKTDEKKAETKTEPEAERGAYNMTSTRNKFFGGMQRDNAEQLIKRDEVQDFLTRTRGLMQEKRAVTGAELTVPTVLLDLLRDNLHEYSKLIKVVNLRPVAGKARMTVAGAIPEGIWMEACGKLNELNIAFNQIEVDGYKVGGFMAICNATLEDSDLNLANEILTALAQGIGLALDKAILYGTGVKMPVGIVTHLTQATKPAYIGANEPTWKDLNTTNVLNAATTTEPVAFYQDLVLKLGSAKANYATGSKFWAMNETTYATLQAKALGFNAGGAIVTGQTNQMPIIGGEVILLPFIPADHIIGGYGQLYLLAERKGATFAQSEHVQFIEDNTVFKGTARYDGRPIFGDAFIALTLGEAETKPTAEDVTFAPDSANL